MTPCILLTPGWHAIKVTDYNSASTTSRGSKPRNRDTGKFAYQGVLEVAILAEQLIR
ncbi:MAG: hypothetical protein ACOCXT_05800 [Candidatus Dojkabacteria bacterium]